ncbi:hypothetical protein CCMSSC00406_0003678 [Pleurotus cornucopiae]|uniref:Uncharacterized protein n=1 Tax=Pleurotus cornucopiae TaxID=5321 RepID=A0ACB7IJB8_PLECO|nr:hypothetical protein CCMSSC00406_0003678 [Pleurotus cornucopiae]
MLKFTPGVDYALRGATKYLAPSVLLAVLTQRFAGFKVGLLAGLLAIPCYVSARILWSDFRMKREAAKLGARLIPRLRGRWFANLDILKEMNWHFSNGYLGDGLTQILEQYGNAFNFHVLWGEGVFTVCPEHIKLILATDFNNYEKGPRFIETMSPVLGTGVFNSDGSMWKFHRSMTRPFFSRDRISHFDLFDRHAEVLIHRMKERSSIGMGIDVQDLMGRFTLDSATEFLFGSCVHSLNGKLPYPHHLDPAYLASLDNHQVADEKFPRAFLQAQEAISQRERLGPIWPLWEMFGDATKEPMRVVNAFIDPIIQEALRKKRTKDTEKGIFGGQTIKPEEDANSAEVEDDVTLLDHLVKFTSDPVVLKDETLNIMLAGRDTTAATLTVLVYFLAMYPEVLKRLRTEVLSKVGSSKRPTYAEIRDMKYLRAVINEVLRLYPVVPFNVRQSINDTTWPSPDPNEKPLYIPGGTKTMYSVFLMQRRKDLWGPDAEEFDPDRFLDDRLKKYLISNSFAFLPFNAGPRICLGQQFAYNEISFMVIRLLQNFESFTLDEDAQPPETRPRAYWKEGPSGRRAVEKFYPKVTLTLYAYGGLWVKAHEAKEP